jgi:hypothetical protein
MSPDSVELHEMLMESVRMYGICIDPQGFIWTRLNDGDKELVNLTFNTLKSNFRVDYKNWCTDFNKTYSNVDFETAFDRTIHDVFHQIRKAYAYPEEATKLGMLKEEYMNDKIRL